VTHRHVLTVLLDPRLPVPQADLALLLAFQKEVALELARSAQLAAAVMEARSRLKPSPTDPKSRQAAERMLQEMDTRASLREDDPKEINENLKGLATDLEAVDAAPTEAQRLFLVAAREGLDRFELGWKQTGLAKSPR
jgi:hypothetical protein